MPTEAHRGKSDAGGYGDFIHMTDVMAGLILDALKENGLEENTLVIFTSDNGAERYAYERVRNFAHSSSAPLRGLKRDIYEGGHRVPFLVRWPGQIRPGSVRDAMTSQVDILATLAAIVGYDLIPGSAEDSHNQLPVWKEGAPSPRDTIVHNTFNNAYAVRHKNWVLIAAPTGNHSKVPKWFNEERGYAEDGLPGELYNLNDDLAQKNNLYQGNPELVKELMGFLKQTRKKGQVR